MEQSTYTTRPLRIFEDMPERYGAAVVGIVLQSYLRSHRETLERLLERGAPIRLVKGGYRERPEVAFQLRDEIDAAFREDIRTALRSGHRPAVATHDPRQSLGSGV